MRVAIVLGSLLGLAVFTGACSSPPPPVDPSGPTRGPLVVDPPADPPDATPRVVRRLVGESKLQMEKNRLMAEELRDPRGRARAREEADSIDRELDALAARVDNPDSDNLDEVMARLQLLDTRIDLFNEKLRAATERTTAVVKD